MSNVRYVKNNNTHIDIIQCVVSVILNGNKPNEKGWDMNEETKEKFSTQR
tara:strand:- start:168 stop:317 length:150 start_codon:yes stop_codon:yes gene_type:complete